MDDMPDDPEELATAEPDAPSGPPKFIRSRGMKFPYDPRIIPDKRKRLLRSGDYERKEFDAVMKLLQPEDIVVEIGAGMGYMSTMMSKKKAVQHVHAFEANPAMIPYIRSVHAENGVTNVTVHNALLSATGGGTVDFYVRGDFVASSMEDNVGDAHGGIVSVEQVEVRDINALFAEVKPTVLVCDIEGAEAHLLPATDLSCLRGAVVELHPQWIGKSGVQAVFDAMHKAGLTYNPWTSRAKVVSFRKDW